MSGGDMTPRYCQHSYLSRYRAPVKFGTLMCVKDHARVNPRPAALHIPLSCGDNRRMTVAHWEATGRYVVIRFANYIEDDKNAPSNPSCHGRQ